MSERSWPEANAGVSDINNRTYLASIADPLYIGLSSIGLTTPDDIASNGNITDLASGSPVDAAFDNSAVNSISPASVIEIISDNANSPGLPLDLPGVDPSAGVAGPSFATASQFVSAFDVSAPGNEPPVEIISLLLPPGQVSAGPMTGKSVPDPGDGTAAQDGFGQGGEPVGSSLADWSPSSLISFASFDDGAAPAAVNGLGDLPHGSSAVPGQVSTAATNTTPNYDAIDQAVEGNQARQQFGVSGAGIKIGIISDSFDKLDGGQDYQMAVNQGLASPGAIYGQVSGNGGLDSYASGEDEGLAMAEIVHEIAPNAQIYFYTGDGSGGITAAITALTNDGCNVICDDLDNPEEPFYEEGGPVVNAINTAVADGITYVTCAINPGSQSFYEGNFLASNFSTTIPDESGTFVAYNFGTAGSPTAFDTVTVPVPIRSLTLQWDQPFLTSEGYASGNGSAYSLDFVLYNGSNQVVAVGTDVTGGTNAVGLDPVQNAGSIAAGTYKLVIVEDGGTIPAGQGEFKIIGDDNSNSPVTFAGGGIGSGSNWGHNEDPAAITVGAVAYTNTPAFGGTFQEEPFSGSGPGEYLVGPTGTQLSTPVSLNKINITAPDQGFTSDPDITQFGGTSAATPAVAAVVALMLQEDPGLTPAQVANILAKSAINEGNPSISGAGLVDALAALQDLGPAAPTGLALAASSDNGIPGGAITATATPTIVGFGAVGATVTLDAGSTVVGSAAVASNGTWSIVTSPLGLGLNSLTATESINGNVSAASAAFLLGVGNPTTYAVADAPATSDFFGVGVSDVLFQNTSGQVGIWQVDANTILTSGNPQNPGSSWHVVGTGDFDGNGESDILLQNTNGQIGIWEMGGFSIVNSGNPGSSPGPSWRAVGTGDFNGDGKSDILFQNTNGQVGIWEMNGTSVIATGNPQNPGPSWQVIGTGDFNGDGKSDILFQNTNGDVGIWDMNGLNIIASGNPQNPGTAWHVIGTGDFNGDGIADILFQNTSGQVGIWEMNNFNVIASGNPQNPGSAWHVIGTGDFNGDGKSDILFQNTSGQVGIWEMSGLNVIASGNPQNPGTAWHVIPA